MLVDPTWGNPLDAAHEWIKEGAKQLLLVDLDAAAGSGNNHAEIASIVHKTKTHAHLTVAGGINDPATLASALETGAAVVLSTAALADSTFIDSAIADHRDHITIQLDVTGGTHISAPGTSLDGADLWQVLAQLDAANAPRYMVNDVAHHDSWHHGNVHLMTNVVAATTKPVLAGAGVKHIEDLHMLCELAPKGLVGAVIGHALVTGAFTLAEAHAAIQARFDMFAWGPAQP